MEKVRKHRRQANRKDTDKSLFIGDFDRSIFVLLATYRYLTPELISLLLGKANKDYTTDRIKHLVNHGYIKHYNSPRLPLHWPDFLMLDEPAIEELKSDGAEEDEIINLYRRSTDIQPPNFVHDFAACNAIASIEIGAKRSGYEFISWRDIVKKAGPETSIKMNCTVEHTFPNGYYDQLNTRLIPDGLFGIRLPGGQASFFAVELERGTPIEPSHDLKRPSLLKKVLAYRDLQKNGVYKTQLKIPNLRTIFFAKSEARVNTMVETTERVIGPTNQFLFTHVPIEKPWPVIDLFDRKFLLAGNEEKSLM